MTTPRNDSPRIAFVSTRIAGTDGVSLEIAKWAAVLEELGFECFFITGQSDRPEARNVIIEEAHFAHPAIADISRRAFGSEQRTGELTNDILTLARGIRDRLSRALRELDPMVLIAENALTIPLNIPLGIAIVQEVQESGIACVAHHHDFYWERPRFLVNAVDDFIRYAFPPGLPQIQPVVINSQAGEEFSRRTGLSCRIIPNVMDFEHPPAPDCEEARTLRRELGIADDDILVLQPTRVVQRKGIEHAIEFCRRLDRRRAKLVITHGSGDEGNAYLERVRDFARLLDVELILASDSIGPRRGARPDGRPVFTLADAFYAADIVAYPSEYEGFGNAFLEAIYYRRPVLCNRYSIYRTDIEPFGFRCIAFDGFLTDRTIERARAVLEDDAARRQMVDHNYEIGREFFSFAVLRDEFELMLTRPHNFARAHGRNRSIKDRAAIIRRLRARHCLP